MGRWFVFGFVSFFSFFLFFDSAFVFLFNLYPTIVVRVVLTSLVLVFWKFDLVSCLFFPFSFLLFPLLLSPLPAPPPPFSHHPTPNPTSPLLFSVSQYHSLPFCFSHLPSVCLSLSVSLSLSLSSSLFPSLFLSLSLSLFLSLSLPLPLSLSLFLSLPPSLPLSLSLSFPLSLSLSSICFCCLSWVTFHTALMRVTVVQTHSWLWWSFCSGEQTGGD